MNVGWQGIRKKITLGDYFTPTLQRSFQPHNCWDKSFFGSGEYGARAHRNNNQTMKTMKEWETLNDNQRSKEAKGILNDANHINYDVLAPIMV